MGIRILFSVIFCVAVAACGQEPTTPAKTTATVEIANLHIVAPTGGRDIAGGGMKITAINGDFRLVSATSVAAERVELHTMKVENDVMRMRQVDGYDIAAGETFVLEPGGPHLMLFGFDTSLVAGDTAEMLFRFESGDGEEVTLNYSAEIRAFGEH